MILFSTILEINDRLTPCGKPGTPQKIYAKRTAEGFADG